MTGGISRVPSQVKRLAADILNVGVTRVRFKPERLNEIVFLKMRSEVRRYINRGEIYSLRYVGQTSTPTRRRVVSGTHNARINASREYVNRVRHMRAVLREHKDELQSSQYWRLYRSIKSGVFFTRRAILTAIRALIIQ